MSETLRSFETPKVTPDAGDEEPDQGLAPDEERRWEGTPIPGPDPKTPDGGGRTDDPPIGNQEAAFLGHAALEGAAADPGGQTDDGFVASDYPQAQPPELSGEPDVTDPGGRIDDVTDNPEGPEDPGGSHGSTGTPDGPYAPRAFDDGELTDDLPTEWLDGQTVPLHPDENAPSTDREEEPTRLSDDEIDDFLISVADDGTAEPEEAELEASADDAPNIDLGTVDAVSRQEADDDLDPGASRDSREARPLQTSIELTGDNTDSPPGDGVRDRTITGDAAIERAWNTSEPVDAGRSFMPVGDDFHEPAQKIEPAPDQYTVFVHGNTEEVGIRHPEGDWQMLDDKQMADVLRSDPGWNGEPVRLFSCDTGKDQLDGSAPFAQDLANELGVDVTAPTEKAFYSNGEIWVSSTREVADPLTGEIYHLPNSLPDNPDGEWRVFHPER